MLTITGSAVAPDDSKAQIFRALEQFVEQCEPSDVSTLIHEVKIKLAKRCYILNTHRSLLLDLPPELLVEIGSLVLGSQSHRGKRWFAATIFSLLQTCTQLRT